jgi:hypothetical protein
MDRAAVLWILRFWCDLFCRDRRSHGDSHAAYTMGELDLSHDETLGAGEYLAAVRRSLLVIALAPVWLLWAVLFLFRWPPGRWLAISSCLDWWV